MARSPATPPITLNTSTHDLNVEAVNGNSPVIEIELQQTRNQGNPLRVLTSTSPTFPIAAGAYAQSTNLSTTSLNSPNPFYKSQSPYASQEHLLPPSPSFRQRYHEAPTSSRRSSWNSDRGLFRSPFDDPGFAQASRPGSRDAAAPRNLLSLVEKYNITPGEGLIMLPEEKEADDALHDPRINSPLDGDPGKIWTRRGPVNIGGLVVLVAGLLTLLIGFPVL